MLLKIKQINSVFMLPLSYIPKHDVLKLLCIFILAFFIVFCYTLISTPLTKCLFSSSGLLQWDDDGITWRQVQRASKPVLTPAVVHLHRLHAVFPADSLLRDHDHSVLLQFRHQWGPGVASGPAALTRVVLPRHRTTQGNITLAQLFTSDVFRTCLCCCF